MGKTVLVTGAKGFLGGHIAKYFSQLGWRVAAIGHGQWTSEESEISGVSLWADATVSFEALETFGVLPDLIVHCAGGASVSNSMENPYRDFKLTVDATTALLEFVRIRCPRTAMVYLSSAAVYGNVERLPITEDMAGTPVSPYGVHKHLAEAQCQSYARHFGVSVAIVRLFSVYGTSIRKQLLWDASEKIARGANQFFGSGRELRDWLHVSDAVRLIEVVADITSTSCPIFNGGTGRGICVDEIVTKLFLLYGRVDKPIFNGVQRLGDPLGYVAEISKSLANGWQPKMGLDDGLAEYCNWYIAQESE